MRKLSECVSKEVSVCVCVGGDAMQGATSKCVGI